MKRMQQANLFYTNNSNEIQPKSKKSKIKKSFFSVRSNCLRKGSKRIIRRGKEQKKIRKEKRGGRMLKILLEKKFLRLALLSPENKNKKRKKEIYTIHVQSTHNNTIYTISRGEGRTDHLVSTGMCGFKNTQKSTSYASQMAAEKIAGLIKRKAQHDPFYIKMKGLGAGKLSGVRALHHQGIRICHIQECTGLPHNGCRTSKRRRL